MRRKFTEAALPNGLRIQVTHLRPTTHTHWQRRGAKWLTYARILNKDGEILGSGNAHCCYKDVPNRKRGRLIAIGRAVKDYFRGFRTI